MEMKHADISKAPVVDFSDKKTEPNTSITGWYGNIYDSSNHFVGWADYNISPKTKDTIRTYKDFNTGINHVDTMKFIKR
jgi:hypothetical protein